MKAVILTNAKNLGEKKNSKTVRFPILGKVVTVSGKPAVILPKPICDWYGISQDFTVLELSITQEGILAVPKRRNGKYLIGEEGELRDSNALPSTDGKIVESDTGRTLGIVEVRA